MELEPLKYRKYPNNVEMSNYTTHIFTIKINNTLDIYKWNSNVDLNLPIRDCTINVYLDEEMISIALTKTTIIRVGMLVFSYDYSNQHLKVNYRHDHILEVINQSNKNITLLLPGYTSIIIIPHSFIQQHDVRIIATYLGNKINLRELGFKKTVIIDSLIFNIENIDEIIRIIVKDKYIE